MSDLHRRQTNVPRSLLVITLATIILVSTVALLFDRSCYSDLRREKPIYPGAVLANDSHEFLGRSRLIYETADSAAQVEAWYRQEITTILRAGVELNMPVGAPYWAHLYSIQASDDGRTQIVFTQMCP